MSEDKKTLANHWMTLTIEREIYALPVETIREVINFEPLNPVPGASADALGMLTVRGDVVTVLSSRSILDIPEREPDESSKIVILEYADGCYGLCVDNVDDIVIIDPIKVEPAPGVAKGSPIVGTIKLEEDLIIVMNLTDYCSQFD